MRSIMTSTHYTPKREGAICEWCPTVRHPMVHLHEQQMSSCIENSTRGKRWWVGLKRKLHRKRSVCPLVRGGFSNVSLTRAPLERSVQWRVSVSWPYSYFPPRDTMVYRLAGASAAAWWARCLHLLMIHWAAHIRTLVYVLHSQAPSSRKGHRSSYSVTACLFPVCLMTLFPLLLLSLYPSPHYFGGKGLIYLHFQIIIHLWGKLGQGLE